MKASLFIALAAPATSPAITLFSRLCPLPVMPTRPGFAPDIYPFQVIAMSHFFPLCMHASTP
ncbi:MAG: hypothetical protein ACRC2Y_19320 [Aeromonas veronii]